MFLCFLSKRSNYIIHVFVVSNVDGRSFVMDLLIRDTNYSRELFLFTWCLEFHYLRINIKTKII